MTGYWAVAPAEYAQRGHKAAHFKRCWDYDRGEGVIALGWDLGEMPDSPEHLEVLWEQNAEAAWKMTDFGLKQMTTFWFGVRPGDFIVARAGLSRAVGFGRVKGPPFYDASAQGKTWGCSLMPVRWYLASDRPVELPAKFTRFTVYRLTADNFRALESAFKGRML